MFQHSRQRTKTATFFSILELIYHATVRHLRKGHGNAVIGLLSNIMQTLILVLVFYILFSVLGMRGSAIRGDFLLYIMSGIFLFMTHSKAMAAVVGAEGPTSAMMKHAPMNTVVSITSAALSSLYIQVLSVVVILYVYHVGFTRITIYDPVGCFAMILLSWFSGVAIGMVFFALKPWAPGFAGIATTIYSRANMIASGKMFVANQTPSYILVLFTWNPLFHCIDQARGFAFKDYTPHHSSVTYPLFVSFALIMIGLLGEFYTRKHASLSWSAGR
ncbi:ABC transporter permease [Aliiroseovarius sp. PTFE2010]|uniref:ABC transporter permease n=1 Tax=Aliiroseovarius sp. PTFE2010 TaxID=3417190 RepID=UPI003CF4007A